MDNLEKITGMLKEDPKLQEKLEAETSRLLESGEAGSLRDALAAAVKAVTGLELTAEELDAYYLKSHEVNADELDAASGGGFLDTIGSVLNIMAGKVKCEFNSHNFEPTGEYVYDTYCWVRCKVPIVRCTRCGVEKQGTPIAL